MLYFVIEEPILISFGGMHNYRGIIYSPIPKQKKIDNKGNMRMFKNALRIPIPISCNIWKLENNNDQCTQERETKIKIHEFRI
jgi:hypothetical protein